MAPEAQTTVPRRPCTCGVGDVFYAHLHMPGCPAASDPENQPPSQYDSADAVRGVLQALGARVVRINTANGWNVATAHDWPGMAPEEKPLPNSYKLAAHLALIHSEVTEALEAIRHNDRENFTEELADVVIRVLDTSHGLGLDLAGALLAKLEKNAARGHRHGGKLL